MVMCLFPVVEQEHAAADMTKTRKWYAYYTYGNINLSQGKFCVWKQLTSDALKTCHHHMTRMAFAGCCFLCSQCYFSLYRASVLRYNACSFNLVQLLRLYFHIHSKVIICEYTWDASAYDNTLKFRRSCVNALKSSHQNLLSRFAVLLATYIQ